MTLQKLTREQKLRVEMFQTVWGQFLAHLGATFFGANAPNPLACGQQIVEAIIDKVYDVALHECRGTLDLNRLVMLFGYIAGNQFGLNVSEGNFPDDPDTVSKSIEGSAQTFEAAMRVAFEEVIARRGLPGDKPKIILPEGGVEA